MGLRVAAPLRPDSRSADVIMTVLEPSRALTLVVPLYNESHRFAACAPALADFVAAEPAGRLVFVDDGSNDGTADLVERFIRGRRGECIELICRPHRGKGAAIEAGLVTAVFGVAAFCDVDLSTPLSELLVLIDAARRAPVLAIGSRGTAASRLARRQRRGREMLGRAYNRAIQLAVVPGVADTQCGAKAAGVALWQQILPHCHEEGFAWDVEIIALARHLDIPVQEVGIVWRHQDGSRVKPLRDGTRMLRAIPRIRMNVASARRTAHPLTPTDGGVFADDNAARLASADANHWWFRSKATFVSLLIRRFANDPDFLVDVGAGSGGVTAMLGLPPSRALALDGNIELVTASRQRHALLTTACDVTAVPLRDGVASVACLLDVIEHLADPTLVLREATRIVGRDNYLIVNVPAHQWLWSDADRLLGHERRYSRRTLRRELERNGLEVVWISHVFSWLVLPVWVMRRNTSSSEAKLGLGVSSPLISYLSMFLTRLEAFVTRWISLPLGTSVLCVARVLGDPDTTEKPA
jgi:dolichyl-phosphate beta-glucosyltransferase